MSLVNQWPRRRRPWACLLLAWLPTGLSAAVPADLPAYRQGTQALSDHFWDLAASRFTEALKTPKLPPESKQQILLRLAEAHLRGGESALAFKALADPALRENPERPFWEAQTLVAQGRLQEAITTLQKLPETAPHHLEASLTLAGLQQALGDFDASLATLDALLKSDPKWPRAQVLRAAVLFDLGQPKEALAALPDPEKLDKPEAYYVRLTRGRCLLEQGMAREALADLLPLTESPADSRPSLLHYQRAVIDLAKARIALRQRQEAADGLLSFITQNPSSPLLDEAFTALLACLPDKASPTDPILARLREWAPRFLPRPPLLSGRSSGAAGAWPVDPPAPAHPLAPEALFHLALATKRSEAPDALATARRRLTRMIFEYPRHPLAARALLELGRWDLAENHREAAISRFAALQSMGPSIAPEIRSQAMSLAAVSRFNEKDFTEAAKLFHASSDLVFGLQRRAASWNVACSLLAGNDLPGFDAFLKTLGDAGLQTNLELERALYLGARHQPAALASLLEFIRLHPDHPRLPEARLQACLAALDAAPPDLAQATAQLEALEENQRSGLSPTRLALVEIRLLSESGQWGEAATRAAQFLADHPDEPTRAQISYEQGKALFKNKDYTQAGIVLKSLAQQFPESPRKPAALFLAAQAAARGATPQSKKESIDLFTQLAASDSSFRDIARIEKADLLISLSRLEEAVALLEPWFETISKDDRLLVHVGLLLGDALYAAAGNDPARLHKVAELQDQLMSKLPADSPARPRILYKKGRALEALGTQEGENQALLTYLEVVQTASDHANGDWEAIELCGFAALRIYGQRQDWVPAKKLAERIAALRGPRAAEAAKRAKSIGQQQMIWDD